MKTRKNLKLDMTMVSKVLVEHTLFLEAVDAMEECFQMAKFGGDSTCVAIVGKSGAGKTRSLEHFESLYPRTRHDDFLAVPVLRIKVNAKPTIRGLAGKILLHLGDPLFNKGTENELTERAETLLHGAKTGLIILDEFQQFADQGGHKIQHHVADWLKVLVDDMKIGLVVSGLERSIGIIKSNEQLERRFQVPLIMKSFDWALEDERLEFLSFLEAMQNSLQPFELPKLDSEEMGFRFYCATGGLIGNIVKILAKATYSAAISNNPKIGLSHLATAYRRTIWGSSKFQEMPFSCDFYKKLFSTMKKKNAKTDKSKAVSIPSIVLNNTSDVLCAH